MCCATRETIVYGGAFNPPTLAHQAIVQACIEYAEPRGADVWLLPSANRRDKTIEGDKNRRIALLEALVKDVVARTVQVGIVTLELDRDRLTETCDTVRVLGAKHPERTFTWVFGHDSLETMSSWRDGGWLIRNLSILAVGELSEELRSHENIIGLPVPKSDIRSTEVRRRLASGEEFGDLVGAHVAELLGA